MTTEVPYQAISLIVPNSAVMAGMAVEIIVLSNAEVKILRTRPTVMKSSRAPQGYYI